MQLKIHIRLLTSPKLNYSHPSTGSRFQDVTQTPKSADAQVPYIRWCRTVHTGSSPYPQKILFSVHGWLNPWMGNPGIWKADCLLGKISVWVYLHSSYPCCSRVNCIPVLLFGGRPCTQWFRSTNPFHLEIPPCPAIPLGPHQGKERGSHWVIFRCRAWKGTAHPFSPHQQLSHLVTWLHLIIKGSSCVLVIERKCCLFYLSPSIAVGFAALFGLWFFHHLQWREHWVNFSITIWLYIAIKTEHFQKPKSFVG